MKTAKFFWVFLSGLPGLIISISFLFNKFVLHQSISQYFLIVFLISFILATALFVRITFEFHIEDRSKKVFRFDTFSVSIDAKPKKVWQFVADLNNWKQFSDFGKNLEQVSNTEWITHTSQGDIKVIPKFNKDKLLLDHDVIIASGESAFIPYRVVPNSDGAELIMTNQQTATVSDKDYKEQLQWMKDELNNIKKILEL